MSVFSPRKFVSIRRIIDPNTGSHTLDAIASDGSAWWRVISGATDEQDTSWQPMEALPPREEPTLG